MYGGEKSVTADDHETAEGATESRPTHIPEDSTFPSQGAS